LGLRRLANNHWVSRVVLLIWVVTAVFIMFLLNQIDLIVHGDLYNFGLQPSIEWWNPYWFYTRLIYFALGLSIVLSIFATLLSFAKKTGKVPETKAKRQPRPQPVISGEPRVRDNHMLISCPSCKKVFGKPLVMLNFESGKTQLVNVCPYCNRILGTAENEKSGNIDFQVPDWKRKIGQ
jgi:uncharacterized Zn-finger protein